MSSLWLLFSLSCQKDTQSILSAEIPPLGLHARFLFASSFNLFDNSARSSATPFSRMTQNKKKGGEVGAIVVMKFQTSSVKSIERSCHVIPIKLGGEKTSCILPDGGGA